MTLKHKQARKHDQKSFTKQYKKGSNQRPVNQQNFKGAVSDSTTSELFKCSAGKWNQNGTIQQRQRKSPQLFTQASLMSGT